LEEALTAAPAYVVVHQISGEAVGLTPIPGGVRLLLDGLRHVDVQRVALCTGHMPPSPPAAVGVDVMASGRYVADPWEAGALDHIDRNARVLILGSGLTMVDVALSLVDNGRCGDILALSRRGLLPALEQNLAAVKDKL
ncbi:FAD/NAD(P)-binding protein, partial [bacterium]|nr:FAD/NAD(P)-binding protein [bacterium]